MSFLKASSAASRLGAPSPTPSNSSNSGAKRKRPADDVAASTVYSQPLDTGTGNHIFTQVTYTIEFLRGKSRWMTFQEITEYLNIPLHEDHLRTQLEVIFRSPTTSRIEHNPRDNTYRYKPKYDIRNAAQLKGWLQTQKSAQGLAVRELKDGWPNVHEEIREPERKREILVNRNKKDQVAKTVWINDPSLMHNLDEDFRNEWHKILLPPNPDDLRNKLVAAGLKPSSAPRAAMAAKPKEKKKKAPRRGGKQTNTHMASILKDYSHKRK
ncbi:transcription initiation factor IIE, beta subunit [Lindgomyces ingoldianus]|uniref:Transcription initiation factor IIE, beta subunit n=1 Tax=Lindgomyces ingoldianus TaxID=673940 RepID=A0ACB6QNQ6_9PLEO|nr:transcription initiation factor IIE, beta subunit [Lindgomyces ingoldianus]KAF2468628.1 transcription initiation factor IIE, beta subunit [Lindgomyces ingoldianus]